MQWLKQLFKIEDNAVGQHIESDLSVRVAEIQSRIATLRRSIEGPTKSARIAQTQPQPVVATEQSKDTKAAEMQALKAKLLGKKL